MKRLITIIIPVALLAISLMSSFRSSPENTGVNSNDTIRTDTTKVDTVTLKIINENAEEWG